jgi:hypothetical protein
MAAAVGTDGDPSPRPHACSWESGLRAAPAVGAALTGPGEVVQGFSPGLAAIEGPAFSATAPQASTG